MDSAFEADARDVGVVEEDVGRNSVQEEDKGRDQGEECGEIGAEGRAGDEGGDGFEESGLCIVVLVGRGLFWSIEMKAYFDRGYQSGN